MNIEKKNSIKPFWSWNDKLEQIELERQITLMNENGVDGFFMHARGGLKTEYMSEEWFRMIEVCLDKAEELGMEAWVYDENGWPSGTAGGKVTSLGIEYQQKKLCYIIYTGACDLKEHILACFRERENGFEQVDTPQEGDIIFYYDVIPGYIDALNKEAIALFLKFTHDEYRTHFPERLGNSLKGFFTDEPQFCGSPWSHILPETFSDVYGYDLIEKLPYLFFEKEGYEAVRNDFQCLVAKLFQESFMKQMYDWCTEHHCKLTGHMMGENTLMKQMNSTNGVMSCYEYFHEPGIDHLRRKILSPVVSKQLGSVASQLGRKTLTESFGLCGWDVSLNELKWMAQWQYVNGVTSLCPHLEAYSIRGIRKRDYPASYFIQLPWFKYVNYEFADYFSKLGALLDSGEDIAPLLVIHPIRTAYILHQPFNEEVLKGYNNQFENITQSLNDERILHHYGDETIIEHYGDIVIGERDCKLKIGKCCYKIVLLPNLLNLASFTVDILLKFTNAGGRIYAIGQLPEFEEGRITKKIEKLRAKVNLCEDLQRLKLECNEISPIKIEEQGKTGFGIHLNLKSIDNGSKLLYVVNNEMSERNIKLEICGTYAAFLLDIIENREEQIDTFVFEDKTKIYLKLSEYGSAILVLRECEDGYFAQKNTIETIDLQEQFKIVSSDDNVLTLDKCIYRVDDGEWSSEIAVINLQNRLLELQRTCRVEMKFRVEIGEKVDCSNIQLAMENPEKFKIFINGSEYSFCDCGQYLDRSIRKSEIGSFLNTGLNIIHIACNFKQPQEVYDVLFTPDVHESLRNKLVYDTELENIYLIGQFSVEMKGEFKTGDRRCLFGGQEFRLIQPVRDINITDITHQGYCFFSGQMSLEQNVELAKTEGTEYHISFKRLNAPAARVYVNDCFAGNMMFSPFDLNVTKFVKDGSNRIVIQLLSGNRNVFGPHHRPEGECYAVGPTTFSNQFGWPDEDRNMPLWTDDYNFVLFGVEL